jgi:4-amino-4-deoxy-L-arabinose transferase-like glycosyltransferase
MHEPSSKQLPNDQRIFGIIALIALVMWFATNLPWQLDDYDQAKQAFTSFEMVKQGHWFYQHTPRGRVATKPPLVAWISAGVFGASRSWDLAWRLPSFAAAVALALCLARSATAAYGVAAGIAAFGSFVFNLLTPRLATLVRTDLPLALVLFLIGLAIWRKVQSDERWQRRDRIWMFALLTAGMLIKGPIVYAFLLPGIVCYQWWRRKTGAASAWFGWWPWLASLAIFLVWAIAGMRFVSGFYEQVVVREFLGRFSETVHRPQPIYFYLPHLLHKFAPWSLVMVAFAWLIHRRGQPVESLWGFTRPSAGSNGASTQEIDPFSTTRMRYLVAYPVAKSGEAKLASGEAEEPLKIGERYPDIKQLVLYSFGLDDRKFLVVYETEDLLRFSDLLTELRHDPSNRFLLQDTPVYTAIYHPAPQTLALWK